MAASETIKKHRPKVKKHKQGKPKEGRKKDRKLNAKRADKYDLYQRAVNSPDNDVDFLIRVYKEIRGKEAKHIREDFCGTALMSSEWLSRSEAHTAEGFDLDPEPIEWGKRHNFEKVEGGTDRMTFHLKDVREPADRFPDITTASNFSYWIFRTRAELLAYFKSARENLADDGIFVIDLYGGPEAMIEMEEVRELGGGVQYIWDQLEYWPGSGEYKSAIHFSFKDGSRLENAFQYEWRYWHLTELKDVLIDAGFKSVDAYFEGTDEDDEESGDGNFEKDERGENCEAWIAYLVSTK